jgi:hypothetical protein
VTINFGTINQGWQVKHLNGDGVIVPDGSQPDAVFEQLDGSVDNHFDYTPAPEPTPAGEG